MKVHLRPVRAELLVPMSPGGPVFPREGAAVELTTWIARRMQDGDLVRVEDRGTSDRTRRRARAATEPKSEEIQ